MPKFWWFLKGEIHTSNREHALKYNLIREFLQHDKENLILTAKISPILMASISLILTARIYPIQTGGIFSKK